MQSKLKNYYRYYGVASLLLLMLAVCACGGNGQPTGLGQHNTDTAPAAGVEKSAAIMPVSEAEISKLPAWQQELLSDPGWNQPYIAQRQGTPMPTPTLAELREGTVKAMAEGMLLYPRDQQAVAKGASWYGDGGTLPAIAAGEYENLAPNATPPYGCNNNGTNASPSNHALEDLIVETASWMPLPTYRVSYVREGLCTPNYFNTLAGANKNQSAAVYQAFCSINDGTYDPQNPPLNAAVAEVSYRSSLVPNGAPGGTCDATAYAVKDYYWRAFNGNLSAIPNGPVDLYNVFIAPSGLASSEYESEPGTTGAYQPFYFGNVSACYGGAWIIGLTAADTRCQAFDDYFDSGSSSYVSPGYWYRPIYGVLLQRWMDMALAANQPWTSEFGWPVYGPVAYANGAMQLNSKGPYYMWGMWFERGFIWWVDYDQSTCPSVPDEAQAFRFTGKNIYCWEEHDRLIQLPPATFYGNAGPLGVNVTMEATSTDYVGDPLGATWEPIDQNTAGTEYYAKVPDGDGLATVAVKMRAQGYGGTPNENCLYKTYVWAFRDGTIQPAGSPYATSQMNAFHVYGDTNVNKASTYVVRVQVQDEVGFAYGDSLPMVLVPNMMCCNEIMVIRDDAPTYDIYNANFDALLADLDSLGITYNVTNFSPTVVDTYEFMGSQAAIWYRGGPGAAGEPTYTTPWTAEEETAFNAMLSKNMLLISQAHGSVNRVWDWSYWGWDSDPDSQYMQRVNYSLMSHTTDQKMGLTSNEDNGMFGWLYVMMGSEMGTGKANTRGPQRLGIPGAFGYRAAEYNLLTGSSGKIPRELAWGTGGTDCLQFCGRGWYPPFGGAWVNPGWSNGMQANPTGTGGWNDGCYGAAVLSYGCASSGGSAWNIPGPGRFWCWGMPYAKLSVTQSVPAGMTRAEVLQNVLSWLSNSLYFSSAGGAMEKYDGPPEIVQVMPAYWTETVTPTYVRGAVCQPGVSYPDPSGTNVYRTDYTNETFERYLSTSQTGNTNLNCNDIDFQFPWYAYITTTNGTVETSDAATVVPPVLSTDDTLAFGGLLVSDADVNWSRYTPPAGQLPNCQLNLMAAGTPMPQAAGYFIATTGDTSDEIRAKYGTAAPALAWNNSYPLEVEVIAHWSSDLVYGANPARLYWSMYPGQSMFYPGTSTFFVDRPNGWNDFRGAFDIDPTASVAGRTGSTWNAANFTFTSLIADGRVVSFDYRSIPLWNPDLNCNGDANQAADGPADKFPIRCRLFADYAAYTDSDSSAAGMQPYVWPDNQPPVTSYVEGGCYVVDTGAPVTE